MAAGDAQASPGSPQKALETRTGHAGWDFKDAFWEQWGAVLRIRSGGVGDLTGAVEALATLARMAADDRFVADWRDRPVHVSQGIRIPDLSDNQAAMDIIADLVRRKGWAEKRRLVSVVKPWTTASTTESKPPLVNGLEG